MNESTLLPLYIFGTILISGFALTLVVVLVIQKQRQAQTRLERQRLEHEHEKELLRLNIEVQEQTLQSIAGEIHDGVGQLLGLSQLQLASLRSHIAPGKDKATFEDGLGNLRQAIGGLRALSHSLHSEFVSKQRLDEFVATELERFRKATGLKSSLHVNGSVDLPSTVLLPVFRIIQEALQNVVKHAQAQTVTVTLTGVPNGLNLSITDDGVGIDAAALTTTDSLGITSMKRRAMALKGTLSVAPGPERGTAVHLFIPNQY